MFGNVKVIERTFTTLGRNEPWRAMATKQKHCDQLFNDTFPLKNITFSTTTK